MDDTYKLLDQEVESAQFTMGPGEHARTLPKKVTDQRAAKAAIATGQDAKQLTEVFGSPEAEQMFRDNVARQTEVDFHKQKLDLIDKIGQSEGGMTPVKADMILSLSRAELEKPPSDAELEKKYSENVMKMLYANATTDSYVKAVEAAPEKTNVVHDIANDHTATREYAQKLWEDNNTWDAAGGVTGYLWDIGEQFFPGMSWFHKYDKEEYGILPGENMQNQIESMWLKPFDYRVNWIKTRYDTISQYNKQDAQDWLQGVMHYANQDAVLESMFAFADVAGVVPAGRIAKGVKMGEKAVAKGVIDPAIEAAYKTALKEQSAPGKAVKLYRGQKKGDKGGLFWSPNPAVAKTYAGKDGEVLTQEKTFTNLLVAPNWQEAKKKLGLPANTTMAKLQKAAKEAGYDGMHWTKTTWGEEYVDLSALRSSTDEVKQGMKDTVKALASKDLDPVKVLGDTGHVDEAATIQAKEALAEVSTGEVRTPDLQKLDRKLLSIYNPGKWAAGSRNLSGEATRRILEAVSNARSTLRKVIDNPNQAMRLTEEAVLRGVEQTKDKLRRMYNGTNDSIMDTKWRVIDQADTGSQTNEVVMALGNTNALPFNSADDAKQAADHLYMIPDEAYKIVQEGKGFHIEVAAPIDETDTELTKALVSTLNQTPKSIWNTFIGFLRTPEDLLSPMSRQNRNVVVPLAQETARLYEAAIAPSMKKLTKNQTERLDELMKINRDFQKGDERGMFWDSISEYEQAYYDTFKAWPTEAETEAYMAIREMSDFDWAVRSLSIARDKKTQGIMRIRHKFTLETFSEEQRPLGSTAVDDFVQKFDIQTHDVSFDGKPLDSLPTTYKGPQPGVFLLKSNGESGWSLLDKVDRVEVDRLIKEEGYRVYQTASSYDRPFTMLPDGNQDAAFIIIKGGTARNVDVLEQLPYKAGFHVEYPPGFYTKIPQFYRDASGRRIYGNDKSVMFHTSEAQAKKYAKALDAARVMLQEARFDDLEAFLKANLPHNLEEFKQLMADQDLNVPIFYTKSGQTAKDAAKGHMGHLSKVFQDSVDLGDSEFNLMTGVNRKFAQEKNIELPSAVRGSEGNPIFAYRGSHTVSPLATMNRAMHQAIRMNVYDNYQKQAVASFIEEFANPETLGGSVTKRSIDSIRRNPISFLMDPMWETGVLDKSKLAAAKNVHRSIIQLLGMPSDLSRNLDWVQNKLLNSVFEKFGDNAVEKVADFAHTKLKDPAKYARSVAFHAKLGLFNPVQLFLQGQSIVHAAAVTGNLGRSYKAGAASSLMRLLSLTDNENVISGFAKKARVFGWNENDFTEAFKAMREAGIWNVEGDVATLDDMQSAKLFRGKAATFLDKGTVFFKEGERFVRLNAFNTAYLEWKAANPGKKLSSREMGKLLTRYDDLALNMTRKSTAAFQQGIFSLPTQFSTYQIHLSEQLLGKRLTKAERARALTMYTTLYGLPAGAAAVTLWPWAEDIKQAAMERGIDTNNGVMDVLVNGIMSNAVELATGKETNIGERYGPGGLSFIRDIMDGDKKTIELLFGPSGSVTSEAIGGILDTAAPVIRAMAAGDPSAGNESYPIIWSDISARLSTISSWNNGRKLYVAANYGKFMSKNEMFQTEGDLSDGLLAAFLGADPRAISDSYYKLEEIQDIKAMKQEYMQKVVKNLKRAGESTRNSDEWNRYMKAAKLDAIEGGLTPNDYQRALKDAAQGLGTSFVDSINNAWVRSAPVGVQWKRKMDLIEQKKVKQ